MLSTTVPAGTSVLQALDREADIETRYGGRFVQSIEGVEGDLGKRRDWFFFVNGIEPGRGAAEVKLRPGDIAWWDHRSWAARMAEPVVVGAFPEPFVHGWEGRRRPVELRLPAGFEADAPALRRLLGGPGGSGEPNVFEVTIDETAEGATLVARRGAARRIARVVQARGHRASGPRRPCRAPRRPHGRPLPVHGPLRRGRRGRPMKLAPVPATILFASAGIAGLLASHLVPLAALTLVLLVACLRAPARRRRPYLYGALATGLGIFVFSPFLAVEGYNFLWQGGPTLPVLGQLGVTSEEIQTAALNGLRLSTLALAFSAYALLVDHDRLVAAAGFAPRSAFAVALATRLVPSLERDAGGLSDAVRGRGVAVSGARGHAKLLSPLVAGSLERAVNLAEAMEARGFGRQTRTRAPGAPWTSWDRVALAGGAFLILAGALWL